MNTALLWLTKTGFYLYINGSASLLNFQFLPESVKYFDVFDESKLTTQLELFIKQNNLSSLQIYFAVSPEVIVEKELTSTDKTQVDNFLDLVPYEQILFKSIKKAKTSLVIAFNADFYRIIAGVFEKYNSKIVTVLPYILLGSPVFSLQSASSLLKKADSLKSETMVSYNIGENENADIATVENFSKVEEKSSLPILLPVFLILIVVLVIVIIISRLQQTPTILPPTIETPTPTIFIIPTVQESPAVIDIREATASPSPIVNSP